MKSRKTSEIEKLGERVYKSEDYLEVLKDVIEDITKQTHFMSDEELQYDRTRFIRQVKDLDIASLEEKNGYEGSIGIKFGVQLSYVHNNLKINKHVGLADGDGKVFLSSEGFGTRMVRENSDEVTTYHTIPLAAFEQDTAVNLNFKF